MPIDLTGIKNENEFYSDHYLTTVFEGDIKETIERWNEKKKEGGSAPHQEFGTLATPYIRVATEYKEARDTTKRIQIFRQFAYDFLGTLGYQRQLQQPIDADGTWIPALGRITRSEGTDLLWIIEALAPAGEDFVTDPLALDISAELTPPDISELPDRREGTYEDTITTGIFGLDQPPRFVLLLSMAQAVLIDHNKWAESRLLRFDFTEIFSRKEPTTFQAMAALLHRESLAPSSGKSLIDTIDEESHRHTHGVSKDLKYALREAIELIGNEAAKQIVALKKVAGETAYQSREGEAALDARQLSLECLRYMYRLLFLFYIEARPDLSFAPMKSEAYRKGYSLESLRELELIPLTTDEEKGGHYLNESLDLLFRLIYEGTPNSELKPSGNENARDFDLHPVRTHLFDPDTTQMLAQVHFSNETLQRVIQLMSLSREEGKRRRGRISYAQLGINQLGAVYEALLSYSGFFAQEDLYEVKKANDSNPDALEEAYFVPKSDINKYAKEEIVYDGNEPKIYPKGRFVYRLAGRDRENSASYYTPEILTHCLVKYTLKELLKDKTADDILKLTICEPAMGSAAFLVEAVNQLSDAYLTRKQEELSERIPHDRYAYERQKVRAYITDRNTFGVDLNPIAMELGQVSLWLNCIHEGGFVPWFGDQLFAGNSLIGARREVYPVSRISRKIRNEDRWFSHAPRPLKSDAPRKPDEVYHFLLSDPNMADYKKSIVEALAPEQFEKLKEWRKDFCTPLDLDEIVQLKRLSAVIDELFEENMKVLTKERKYSTDPMTVWGQLREAGDATDFKVKNRRLAGMRGEGARNAMPYQRLKIAMDYWCALWFWPLEHVDLLPTRDEFLLDMTLILEGNVLSSCADMFKRNELLNGADPHKVDLFDHKKSYGQVDTQLLKAKSPRLQLVAEVAERAKFFHWEVELSDIMISNDGFDVILGNPPWIKLEWQDSSILADHEPYIAIRGLSASQIEDQKTQILKSSIIRSVYSETYQYFEAGRNFVSGLQNYPLSPGGQPNLYKCFIGKSLTLTKEDGFVGLLHSEGHFTDPSSTDFRKHIYHCLRSHFQFRNQIQKHMFPDIPHREEYSINIYGSYLSNPSFVSIHNLFLPQTIDECFQHDGVGRVPGIKTEDGKWEVRGHRDRIVAVNSNVLKIFSNIMEGRYFNDIQATRMPAPHSQQVIRVLEILASTPQTFSLAIKDYLMTPIWHESGATKKTKILREDVGFRDNTINMVITGPNFFAANPLAKTPRRGCKSKADFDVIDLNSINEGYMPRAKYTNNIDEKTFREKMPSVSWDREKKHVDFYRIGFRKRIRNSNERTLISCILPPGISHIHAVATISFSDDRQMINTAALFSSLPYDFYTKASGISEIHAATLKNYPWAELPELAHFRVLQLNCLTKHYADLWDANAPIGKVFSWANPNRKIQTVLDNVEVENWSYKSALRSDLDRRQAMLEIDVLVALSLELSLGGLVQMYRVQFPVMQSYDQNTWYDQSGRIVFTNSKNLSGVGLDRETWEASKDITEGTVSKIIMDDTLPGGPIESTITYHAPFILPNREEDYERTWSVFYPEYASKAVV